MTEENLIDAVCHRIIFDKERLEKNELGRIEVESFNLSEFWAQFGAAVQALNNEVTKIGFACGNKPFPSKDEIGSMMQDLLQYYSIMRDLYLVLPPDVGAVLYKSVTSVVASIMSSLADFTKSLHNLTEKGAKDRLTLTSTFWDACNAVDALPKDNHQATLKVIEDEVNLAKDALEELETVDQEKIKPGKSNGIDYVRKCPCDLTKPEKESVSKTNCSGVLNNISSEYQTNLNASKSSSVAAQNKDRRRGVNSDAQIKVSTTDGKALQVVPSQQEVTVTCLRRELVKPPHLDSDSKVVQIDNSIPSYSKSAQNTESEQPVKRFEELIHMIMPRPTPHNCSISFLLYYPNLQIAEALENIARRNPGLCCKEWIVHKQWWDEEQRYNALLWTDLDSSRKLEALGFTARVTYQYYAFFKRASIQDYERLRLDRNEEAMSDQHTRFPTMPAMILDYQHGNSNLSTTPHHQFNISHSLSHTFTPVKVIDYGHGLSDRYFFDSESSADNLSYSSRPMDETYYCGTYESKPARQSASVDKPYECSPSVNKPRHGLSRSNSNPPKDQEPSRPIRQVITSPEVINDFTELFY